jgi:O-antigen/teichoic acid export membrane protein
MRHLAKLLRRGAEVQASWGMADQTISSATNFLILWLAARHSGIERFGLFSVAFTVYIVALWVTRSLVGEPFTIRHTPSPPAELTRAGRQAVGAAILLGCLIGLPMAAPALLVEGWSVALVLTGLSLPALLAQDTYRYVLIASGKVRAAALNDAFWLAAQLPAVAWILWSGAPVEWLLAAFGLGAAAAAALGAHQAGVRPDPAGGPAWLRGSANLGLPYLVELLGVYGAGQLALLGLAAVGEVAAVGRLRAALLLLSPVTVLCAGLFLVGAPEAMRIRHRNLRQLPRFLIVLSSSAIAVAAWAGALFLVPDRSGQLLLGGNWLRGTEVLASVTLMTLATIFVMAGMLGLRAIDAVRATLPLRLLALPVFALATLGGVKAAGAQGAAAGLAAASALSAVLTWVAFRRALRNLAGADLHAGEELAAT